MLFSTGHVQGYGSPGAHSLTHSSQQLLFFRAVKREKSMIASYSTSHSTRHAASAEHFLLISTGADPDNEGMHQRDRKNPNHVQVQAKRICITFASCIVMHVFEELYRVENHSTRVWPNYWPG
ncbi:hypothetical protein RvY_13646 [Ramazzottius varieornatus]|uniref:Uncharacterized protein n=1 Tax=Ramazzottius varieornatus TaxID=947166 RepID=A0A1D1VNL7_RAMVA|nr:hypothetical protein RvY_13646 [Ramazzottius varieornatus]